MTAAYRAGASPIVLTDEIVDGGWGLRGEVLTLAKIQRRV
jgi:hypothetical protein